MTGTTADVAQKGLPPATFAQAGAAYVRNLQSSFTPGIFAAIETLAQDLHRVWVGGQQVFICGNGGSAANAIHLANDLHYGIGACGAGPQLAGLRVDALPANAGVITCLANDTGYENIYSHQLQVKSRPGDILIVLSGSGNSTNVVRALKIAKDLGLSSYAILAFSGGLAKDLADVPIHFPIDDMQIAEDLQLIVGHICMKWLSDKNAFTNKKQPYKPLL